MLYICAKIERLWQRNILILKQTSLSKKFLANTRIWYKPDAQLLGYDKFWDIIRTERTFFNSAHREGHESGRKEGLDAGMEKGMEKGMIEGRQEEKLETIQRLKAKGFDIATISIATGMSEEEINEMISS